MKYIHELLQSEINQHHAAGSILRIRQHGELIYDEAFGVQDIKAGTPVATDTIFKLYSATKPITACAVMILAERGQLDLLDPVSLYLPGFSGQKVALPNGGRIPAEREVRIQDLLTMTAGLVYPGTEDLSAREMDALFRQEAQSPQDRRLTTAEFCSRMGNVPLAFQPGASFRYSVCADVLGGIVETVSGMRYGEFLRKELFAPLEMPDTAFFVPDFKKTRLATIYEYDPAGGSLHPYRATNPIFEPQSETVAFESGGAGLFSTLADYEHFVEMLRTGGTYHGRHILGERTIRYLSTDLLTPTQHIALQRDWPALDGYSYGGLMRVMTNPAAGQTTGSVGEFGWDGFASIYFMVDPQTDLTLCYFLSRVGLDNAPLRRRLRNIVYGQL